jgi:peptidoglycan glycosyltransferase
MSDPIARNARRLAGLSLLGFLALAAATFYWGFLRATELAARPDNLRQILFDRRIQRGRILDRHGRVLAETRFDAQGLPQRIYLVPAAAPVVGFQTWRYGAGALDRATYGAGGAEAAYDLALRGDLGLSPRQLVASRVLHRPQAGHDVVLSLDAALQTFAAGQLGGREGAVVVVDVETGAVRALASNPTFDAAALDEQADLANDPARPLLNRATQGLFPPGSAWKTVTLAAALEEGITTPDAVVDDGDAVEYFEGFPVRCNNNPPGQTTFDITHAYGWSCNVTFARLGTELGAERYRRFAKAFGLGDAPPFALPVAESRLSTDEALPLPELASAAFGQGELLVTPLEMALVAAAMARDGSLPVPYLLEDVPSVRWSRLRDERGTWRRAVSAGTARTMREIMTTSVRDGWARTAAQRVGVSVAGKTGTAQVGNGAPHSWFIGFAPADQPRYAVAVVVVHGGEGSAVAAPIGGRVLEQAVVADGH